MIKLMMQFGWRRVHTSINYSTSNCWADLDMAFFSVWSFLRELILPPKSSSNLLNKLHKSQEWAEENRFCILGNDRNTSFWYNWWGGKSRVRSARYKVLYIMKLWILGYVWFAKIKIMFGCTSKRGNREESLFLLWERELQFFYLY